ncbi:glycoside hydrolase domain-containing protein [Clostridium sp. JS66]|uniref:glycoside hydrolase domain-containing protein n=1 Tax=Clostridium sp. JS66 TaxID=3064705 RepID=UPI00298DC428|nr:glycoside hydrolase domain-containing protein [Clostridium sp. JS66]WPC42320.1 DUF1906 domain-containing protein [Clostridium sp. JS66]
MDEMVLKTQKWLNSTYNGKGGYSTIPEDGATGWATMNALVTALQIELGIYNPNGNFGPATTAAFKMLVKGTPNVNQVYILQGGLFCKGYNPTGFTGVFGDNTAAAVSKLQLNAGLDQTGNVNALLMKSILSMDAFTLLNFGGYNGDPNIRIIQQRLNQKYSSNQYFASDIGLVPCDGIYARATNKALLYALQIEEGISVPNGVFGPTTKSRCPVLSLGTTKSNFTFLLQCALYCNKFDPNGLNGKYEEGVKMAVTNFQKFCCLSVDGTAGMQTWASLLVSTGDNTRKGTACDCASTITSDKAKTLKNNGYKAIGRYLTGKYKMTSTEINTIFISGLKIIPIFETGGYELSYFTPYQGIIDAKEAIQVAHDFGFNKGTIIYFTVDFDALDGNVTSSVLPYFREIYRAFSRTKTDYKIGIYGARNVCSRVAAEGYSCSSFVCDMSSGFSGNLGYPLPKDWTIDQISTVTLGSGSAQIEIDNNICSVDNIGESNITLNNNASGLPDPAQKVLERIVVSGSEYDCKVNIFDVIKLGKRYKYNFIEPAINELKKFREQYPYDIVTWLISSIAYDYSDLENFKDTAKKLQVNIAFFKDTTEFASYINRNRDKCKIGNITIFSHGIPGSIEFGYDQGADLQSKLSFNIYHLKDIKASSFSPDVFTQLYCCNGATKVDSSSDETGLLKDIYGKSMAGEWYSSGFGKIRAANGKTDYTVIFGDDVNKHAEAQKVKGYCENGAVNYPIPSPGVVWIDFPS